MPAGSRLPTLDGMPQIGRLLFYNYLTIILQLFYNLFYNYFTTTFYWHSCDLEEINKYNISLFYRIYTQMQRKRSCKIVVKKVVN